MTEGIINKDELKNLRFLLQSGQKLAISTKEFEKVFDKIDRLEQENKELKKQHYEALKMLKHEYNGRQRDNEQWFTRCTENHNEDSRIIEKYRSALEEIQELSNIDKEWAVFMKPTYRLEKINKIVCEVLK